MNIALERSQKFAIKIYHLYEFLCKEKHEYTLARRILRSGTSIGANLTEAQYSVGKKEFLAKVNTSLKECAETEYWLDFLKGINLLPPDEHNEIAKDCKDLLHILIATVRAAKER